MEGMEMGWTESRRRQSRAQATKAEQTREARGIDGELKGNRKEERGGRKEEGGKGRRKR